LLALTNGWLPQGRQTPVKQGSNRNIKRMSVLVVAPPRFKPINQAALRCSLRLLISCWRSTRIGGDLSPPIVRLRRPILRTIEIAHQCCWRAAEDKSTNTYVDEIACRYS
jgi:hypothetical protein